MQVILSINYGTHVRFRMELDAAGYAEPTNPRPGLSINQRLSILREHMSRRQSLIPCSMDTLWEGSSDPLIEDSSPQFVGCIFAYLGSSGLNIVELPSPNKGTTLSRRTIPEKRLCGDNQVHQVWVYPDRDLLVWCYEVSVHGSVEEYTFYLQTLSTNESHPDAFEPVIHLAFHAATDIFVRLQGMMMLVEISRTSRIYSMELDKWENNIRCNRYLNDGRASIGHLASCYSSKQRRPRIYPLLPHWDPRGLFSLSQQRFNDLRCTYGDA
ncbi:hypothetical protein ACGC1H_004187 [Rhizoctonia solani]